MESFFFECQPKKKCLSDTKNENEMSSLETLESSIYLFSLKDGIFLQLEIILLRVGVK